MKPDVKDTIIFFVIALTNINFNIWGLIIPYYYSHARYYNPDMTMKTVFNAIIFSYLGFNISTFVFPTLLFVLGLKGMLIFGALVSAFNNVSLFMFSSTFWICTCTAMVGFVYKHFTTVIILYFTTKYPEKSSKLYGIATSGFIVTGFFWANFLTFYINPGNDDMTNTSSSTGYKEKYFPIEIASRLEGIMIIQTLFILGTVFVMSSLFDNPENYKSNIYALIRWLKGEKVDLNGSFQKLSELLSESTLKLYKSGLESKDNIRITNTFESGLIDQTDLSPDNKPDDLKSLSQSEEEFKKTTYQLAINELRTSKFWLLFYASIFRLSVVFYYMDNAKIIGYDLVRNDQLITQVYSVSSFLAMTSSAMSGYIVDKLGLFNCYVMSIGCNLFIEAITFTIIRFYPYLYLPLLALSRTAGNFGLQLSNITLFNYYDPDVALQLVKVYEFHSFIANLVMVIINQWLYVDGNFTYAFLCYFVLDGIAMLVILFKLKPNTS